MRRCLFVARTRSDLTILTRYWPASGRLQYALAGHLQPLWIADGGISELHVPGGVPLGVQKGATFRKAETVLQNGQSVLLFTDGLVEAENDTGEQFTKDRLMAFLKRCEGPPWGQSVLQRVEAWRGPCAANDDLTILEVWRGQAQGGPDYEI